MTAADAPPGMAPLATLAQRFFARLVDSLVLVVLDVVASSAVVGGRIDGGDMSAGRQVVASVLTFALYFAYEGAMTAARGQTLGKMALRIRAARLADGGVPGQAGWVRAAVYALPGALSALLVGPLFWLVNSLWCVGDRPYRQCLHDKAAHTVVVAAL